jgi:hypothetical protein
VQLARLLHLPSRGPKGCTCGHAANAHEHYRRGTDCAMCSCPKFRAGSPAKSARRGGGQGDRGEQAHAA